MIFDPKPKPKNNQVYETISFAFLPYKLKDGRTVWLEKVWKKEVVEYWISFGRERRVDRVLEDAPYNEKFPSYANPI